jgi:hypothetical protein
MTRLRMADCGLRIGARRHVPVLLTAGACALVCALGPAPAAWGWSNRTHHLITEESVQRLPEPLRGLFSSESALKRLKEASAWPDEYRDKLKAQSSIAPLEQQAALRRQYVEEKARHYFDIDAITDEPPPFANFPRDRKEAEAKFGAKAFEEHGTVPWATQDALAALADALTRGATDEIFRTAGQLAHYAADLHTPFHVSKNYNGQLTGNDGIHKALEIGLVVRYQDFYAAEVRQGRTEVLYLEDVQAPLFEWLIQANGRVGPILEAETAARRKTNYNPADKSKDAEKEMEDPSAERSRPYYETFKKELEARGSPEAAAMRDAAAHLAQLFYTAWVRAGKPVSLAPAPPPAAELPAIPYWLVGATILLMALILWPARRPKPQAQGPKSET